MELTIEGLGKDFVMEVGEKDTTETMRQKVASATGLCEDSFRMGFGGKEEGEDITELSAGDTVVLTKTMKSSRQHDAPHPRYIQEAGEAFQTSGRSWQRMVCDEWYPPRMPTERNLPECAGGGVDERGGEGNGHAGAGVR